MLKNTKLNRIAMAVALSVGMSSAAFAQETSSTLKGVITGPQGNPAPGTVVTITHVPSGSVKTVVVGNSGQFSAKGLRVGGPYTVKFDSDKFSDTTVNDVFLNLGEPRDLSLALEQVQNMESIVVTASAVSSSVFGETGPATNFSLSDLENAPAINRDINDVIRADPRVYIDESFSNAVQCAGASPRFNSLTLDGVRMNDNFGLNSNGYPTEGMPFPYDAIEQVAVELAPFDVQYGGFTACNINAVTKSGTNEIHGGLFYDYSSDSLKGDVADGEYQDNGDYTDKRYGFHVGFPILKDTLFFFGAYEKAESAELFEYDIGSRITQADVNRAIAIANSVYGYDAGGTPGSMPVEDEKLLVKLDWNINKDHRASLMYNWNDGFSLSQSDTGGGRVSLSNHFYERGAEIKSTVLSVYSDWSDSFNTELRIGKTDLDNRQNSIDAASGFAEVQIRTPAGGTIYLGPDDSRQSNELNWDNFTVKLAGTYYLDEHTITAGIEYEKLNVFNLFMQHTVGEYRFDSLDDFEAATPARIYYNNSAGTNNPADAGASFSTKMWTMYVQDEFYLTDDIQVMMGLRYDRWTTGDEPTYNAQFEDRYGFSNTGTVDGMDLIQPRIGFNWALDDNLELRGGLGLYSGGNPNVWISNAYSNDGVTNIGLQDRSRESLFAKDLIGSGRPIFDIPQALFDQVAATSPTDGDGNVNATDPDFDVPSEWKFNIGATYLTENDWVIQADILYTDKRNSAVVYDLSVEPTAERAPDGRVIYDSVDGRFSGSDHLLTNVSGGDGSSKVLSVSASKDFDNGFDMSAAYAFTRATDVNPMTSAVAFSNAGNVAVADQRNYGAATSDYEIRHRVTLNLAYTHDFFDGYATRFNLFGNISEGKPLSFVYSNSGGLWEDQSDFRSLIYVPLENDPNVVWAEGEAAFNDLVEAEGLTRGAIMSRNSVSSDWWVKFDVRVEQELPGFMEGHKASAFFVVENLGNLINDDWGVMRQGSFVGDDIISASINDQGQYVYSYNGFEQTVQRDASLWEVRLGVKYTF